MIDHKNKFIFVHIPKNAGTSMENFLFPENFTLFPKTKEEVLRSQEFLYGQDNDSKRFLQHLTMEEIDIVLNTNKYKNTFLETSKANSYFKFCFVRNPWDRAVSEWKWRQATDKSFLEVNFINFLTNYLFLRQNEDHFMPQYKYIYRDKKCLVDFIGRFESLNQDFDYVCKKIGRECNKLLHNNKSERKHYSEYYNSFTMNLIGDVYKRDIDYFNYSF